MSAQVHLDEIVVALIGIALLLTLLSGCGGATKRAPASAPVHYWVPLFLHDRDALCVPAPGGGGYCKPVERVREFIAAQETD